MNSLFDNYSNETNEPDLVPYQEIAPEYQPLITVWLLKLALLLKWYEPRRASRTVPEIFENPLFCSLTGLNDQYAEDIEVRRREQRRRLREADKTEERLPDYRQILQKRLREASAQVPSGDQTVFRNIALLGEMIGLDKHDLSLLTLTAMFDLFKPFREVVGECRVRAGNQLLCRVLACLSGLSEDGFRQTISETGILVSSGVVKVHRAISDLEEKVDLMDGLSGLLQTPFKDGSEMLEKFIRRAPAPTLTLRNFPHLAQDTEVLVPYLRNSVRDKNSGVNLLLHGKPGVGKSEYAQVLAAEAGLELYEIAYADDEGKQIRGEARLRAFTLCQRLLTRSANAVLVFDEIEDVFPSSGTAFLRLLFGGKASGGETAGKAWINRTLEQNPVPAVWISNEVAQIDAAYLRRFDFSVSFPIPPTEVRLDIARYHFGCFTPPDDFLQRIAANDQTTPAQLDRAAKVARTVSEGDNRQALQLIEATLEKSGLLLNQKAAPVRNSIHTGFSLEFLNTDMNVAMMLEGLRRRPKGSFCFYGAAGTGKSELARHLADATGKPLLVKRASDIISKYVGDTEKQIARMFSDARRQGAVLVLDEADSFLSDRRDAQRSWEVTQVNELLTQMEAFDGIFICTTNLMERLDPASLRRFAFKVCFKPLLPEQRWKMFLQELQRLGGSAEDAEGYKSAVSGLEQLTPGDFAVAARQFELWGVPATAAGLLEPLRSECRLKGAESRKIGFVY